MRTLALLTLLAVPALLPAQASVRPDAQLLTAPAGRALATFRDGATVRTGSSRAGAVQVTVQGYMHRSLLGPARDSFRVSVQASGGALLRAAPSSNGRVLALLHDGMGLHQVRRSGEWVEVRRSGWVQASAVQRQQAARAPATRQAPRSASAERSAVPAGARRGSAEPATAVQAAARSVTAEATDSAAGALDRDEPAPAAAILEEMTPTRRVEMAAAPGGSAIGTVEPGARVVPLARDRGWVRVRVEGWVPEASLASADSALRTSPSAADLRADPDGMKGRAVRWEVQVLAFQTADQLRRDMRPDEPYLLARGPGGENAILYLALPPSLVANARAIPSLSTVIITGRIRVAQSAPSGVPIIDVQSLSRK